MKIILIGIQGSGKSTQGDLLSQKLNIPYLSTGDLFREIAREKSRWGKYVKQTINKGLLVPDEKVVPIIEEYLSKPEFQKGYILDGFPRTRAQARAFKDKIDIVFYLDVSDKEALWRLAYRNDKLREDETVKAVRKRIESFHRYTKPVLSYYKKRKVLVVVNGEQTAAEVHKEMMDAVWRLKTWVR